MSLRSMPSVAKTSILASAYCQQAEILPNDEKQLDIKIGR